MIKLNFLCFLMLVTQTAYGSQSQIEYERRYEQSINQIQREGRLRLSLEDLMTDRENTHSPSISALWDQLKDSANPQDQLSAIKALKSLDKQDYSLVDQFFITLLEQEFLGKIDNVFYSELNQRLLRGNLSRDLVFTLLSYQEQVDVELLDFKKIAEVYQEDFELFEGATSFRNKNKEELKDLFLNHPNFGDYRNGRYANGVKLFMFCRKNREQKCMMLMKDKYSNIVRNGDGSIWSQPALGLSRKRLPFNQRNGFTPSGVFHMDGVMPETNRKIVFGKFRRIILDFPKKSTNETEYKKLLPASAHDKSWWKQGVVARDVGRSLFRIHGTGMRNGDSDSSYYPFVPTSGCVSQREKKYRGVRYKDQRLLLDKMMESLELPTEFANEVRIRGLFYVIEIDDKEEEVTAEELISLLDLGAFQP